MYDAVWLYAKAMSLALEQGVSIDNGEELVSIMSELKWTGECHMICQIAWPCF